MFLNEFSTVLSIRLAIRHKPKLLIEPANHIRISKGDNLCIRCFDPYETYSTTISWFRCVILNHSSCVVKILYIYNNETFAKMFLSLQFEN